MDKLLNETVRHLPNERRAMFAMIDLFIDAVERYQAEYDALRRQKDADLKQREEDGARTLRNLKERHEQELQNGNRQVSRKQAEMKGLMEKSEEDAANQRKRAFEDSINLKRQAESARDEYLYKEAKRLNAYANQVAALEGIYQKTDALLGDNWRKQKKMELICAQAEEVPDIQSIQEAVDALNGSFLSESERLYQEAEKIHNSLFLTIFCRGKRNRACQEIYRKRELLRKALEAVRRDNQEKQRLTRDETQSQCQQIERTYHEQVSRIASEHSQRTQGLERELRASQMAGQLELRNLRARQDAEYSQQSSDVDKQRQNAKRNWEARLRKCNEDFLNRMESEFPAQRMRDWMVNFWNYPRTLKSYPNPSSPQMNVLIGEAFLDVSKWFSGDAQETLTRMATQRYPFLFRSKTLRLPYSLSIEEGSSVLLSHDDKEEERVKAFLNSLGIRLICSVPPCQMQFRLIDAYGTGSFQRLTEVDPAKRNVPDEPTVKSLVLDGRVKKSAEEIRKQTQEMKSRIENLPDEQKYKSVRDFNEKNPLSRRTYQPLIMMNFPLELDAKTIRDLTAISRQGRWGYAMFLSAPDKYLKRMKPEIRQEVESMRDNALFMRMSGEYARVQNSPFKSERNAMIRFYSLPSGEDMDAITRQLREKSVQASRVLIDFSRSKDICPDRTQWFTEDSRAGIIAPVGYLDNGLPFRMVFDDSHVHAFVAGNTGSGKTNLLHVLMTSVMLRYAPDEVEIYLVDFKHGLDFRIYTNYNLPNFRAISMNDDPEFVLAMLEHLDEELKRRGSAEILGANPNIRDYNDRHPDQKLSRILLIIDELFVLIKKAGQETQEAIINKLSDFAHRARAFGLHLVVSGQDLCKIENFSALIANQCKTRIALSSDKEVEALFEERDGKNLIRSLDTTDKGACVFSLSDGQNPQIERTAYLNPKEHERILREIGERYSAKKEYARTKILMTNVSNDRSNVFQRFVASGSLLPVRGFLLGEPMSMRLRLVLSPRDNLWIAGGSSDLDAERAGNSAIFFSLLSLILARLRNKDSHLFDIFCTDCVSRRPMGYGATQENRFGQLLQNFPGFADNRPDESLKETMKKIGTLLEQRMAEADNSNCAPLWWLISCPESSGDLTDNDVIRLGGILRDGPRYGIRAVVWTSNMKAAREFLRLGPEMFSDKLCLEMTSDDLKALLGKEPDKKPNGYKAIYSGSAVLARARVYDLPTEKWMEALFKRFRTLRDDKAPPSAG